MSESDPRGPAGLELWDLAAALRRRWGWIVSGLILGLAIGFTAMRLTPPLYASEAMLLVESRWFPQDFLQNPLGKSMRDRLQTLQHRLTSDRALEELVATLGPERFGSDPRPEVHAGTVRAGFHFEIEDAASPEAAVVRLAYTAHDPELARDVVTAMSTYAVEERRQEGARQAAATAEVLRAELEALRLGLAEKAEHLSALEAKMPATRVTGSEALEERRSERLSALNTLQALEAEVARAEAAYTPRHPHLLQLKDQLRRARGRLSAAPIATTPASRGATTEYRTLLREYESGLQTYENLLARRIDATMAERLERTGAMPEIQVLREAKLAPRPVWPDPLIYLGAGAATGLALAIALAMVPVLRRRTFSSVDALIDASGLPVISAIPAGSAPGEGSDPSPRLVVVSAPDSAAAEQFRHALPYLFRNPGTPVALVTSAERGVGKSLCTANLAASAAVDGQRRTLLIDADLRQPTQPHLLRMPEGAGLAECVRGDLSLATAALPTSVPNLYLLRAGDAGDNPVSVFEDERLLKLFDAARREFGAVFIDAPPRLPVVDAALVERLATMVLFVVRAEITDQASIRRGLRGVGLPVGLILNGVNPDAYRRHFGTYPSQPPYRRNRGQ